jgi:hypothetical protein
MMIPTIRPVSLEPPFELVVVAALDGLPFSVS